jgi:hypothetical protein
MLNGYLVSDNNKLVATFLVFCGAQPTSGLDCLIVDTPSEHTIRHTHSRYDSSESDQLDTEAAIYTTHYKHKKRKSIPSAAFEPVIPAIQRPQT